MDNNIKKHLKNIYEKSYSIQKLQEKLNKLNIVKKEIKPSRNKTRLLAFFFFGLFILNTFVFEYNNGLFNNFDAGTLSLLSSIFSLNLVDFIIETRSEAKSLKSKKMNRFINNYWLGYIGLCVSMLAIITNTIISLISFIVSYFVNSIYTQIKPTELYLFEQNTCFNILMALFLVFSILNYLQISKLVQTKNRNLEKDINEIKKEIVNEFNNINSFISIFNKTYDIKLSLKYCDQNSLFELNKKIHEISQIEGVNNIQELFINTKEEDKEKDYKLIPILKESISKDKNLSKKLKELKSKIDLNIEVRKYNNSFIYAIVFGATFVSHVQIEKMTGFYVPFMSSILFLITMYNLFKYYSLSYKIKPLDQKFRNKIKNNYINNNIEYHKTLEESKQNINKIRMLTNRIHDLNNVRQFFFENEFKYLTLFRKQ